MTAIREHILLTVLGANPRLTTYEWGGRTAEAAVAPAALYRLLAEADRPDRILALCTPEAEQVTLPKLTESLDTRLCPIDTVAISSEPTDDTIQRCLAELVKHVPPGVNLTVDVTHGFRHLAFVAYAGVLYLTALRDVRLRAAYYGLLRDPEDGSSRFFDLRPLVELPRWYHAVQVLKDTGSAHAMAGLVDESAAAGELGTVLRTISEAYASGLPIELGHAAQQFLATHHDPLVDVLYRQRLPLADVLVNDFASVLRAQQLTQQLAGPGWKAQVRLDRTELQRQARIIDSYLARDDYATALGLMREWLVVWTMWRMGTEAGWLKYHRRGSTERLLHGFAGLKDHPGLPAQWAAVGEAWEHLVALRNSYAHHGFDKKVTLSIEDEAGAHATAVIRAWHDTLRAAPEFDLPPVPERRLLVSPVGLRPGVLFSALHTADPAKVSDCVVICSAGSKGAVDEACRAAGYSGPVEYLVLDDPFAGVDELRSRVAEATHHILDSGEVLVNVTGGTTLMGVLAERIAGESRRLKRSVHRFALIDRRPQAEQEADPYQVGEPCWLDDRVDGEGT